MKKLITLECCLSHTEDNFLAKKFRAAEIFVLEEVDFFSFGNVKRAGTISTGDFRCLPGEEADTLGGYGKVCTDACCDESASDAGGNPGGLRAY